VRWFEDILEEDWYVVWEFNVMVLMWIMCVVFLVMVE